MIQTVTERRFQPAKLALAAGMASVAIWLAALGCAAAASWRQPGVLDFFNASPVWALLITVVFLLMSPGIPWGLWSLNRRDSRKKAFWIAVISAVILAPLFFYAGLSAFCLAPAAYGAAIPSAGRIVRSQISPDGRFEAIVVDRPSIDGPNHHLFIREISLGERKTAKEAGHLAEDYDASNEILWSPKGDIVVFSNFCTLLAVEVPSLDSAFVQFGYLLDPNSAQRRYAVGQPPKVLSIRFPDSGGFAYRLAGATGENTVAAEAFEHRDSDFLVWKIK